MEVLAVELLEREAAREIDLVVARDAIAIDNGPRRICAASAQADVRRLAVPDSGNGSPPIAKMPAMTAVNPAVTASDQRCIRIPLILRARGE